MSKHVTDCVCCVCMCYGDRMMEAAACDYASLISYSKRIMTNFSQAGKCCDIKLAHFLILLVMIKTNPICVFFSEVLCVLFVFLVFPRDFSFFYSDFLPVLVPPITSIYFLSLFQFYI